MEDAVTISNNRILPERWTVDTLMEPHDSRPYNPDSANIFYRAGFIENRGQGIQKICDECQGIGTELPVYELAGTTLRIRFKALESVLIDQSEVPKGQNGPLDEPEENLPFLCRAHAFTGDDSIHAFTLPEYTMPLDNPPDCVYNKENTQKGRAGYGRKNGNDGRLCEGAGSILPLHSRGRYPDGNRDCRE